MLKGGREGKCLRKIPTSEEMKLDNGMEMVGLISARAALAVVVTVPNSFAVYPAGTWLGVKGISRESQRKFTPRD